MTWTTPSGALVFWIVRSNGNVRNSRSWCTSDWWHDERKPRHTSPIMNGIAALRPCAAVVGPSSAPSASSAAVGERGDLRRHISNPQEA